MYNPHAPGLAAIEHTEADSRVRKGTPEVEEDSKKERRAPLPCSEHGNISSVTGSKEINTTKDFSV